MVIFQPKVDSQLSHVWGPSSSLNWNKKSKKVEICVLCCWDMLGKGIHKAVEESEQCRNLLYSINHFHRDHNAPCLPPKIWNKYCLRFLLGRLQYQGEIRNNGY